MTPLCQSCACWFTSGLSGDEQPLITSPDDGVCKEGPVSVAKNRLDFCCRWRVREADAGGRDARRAAA